MLSAIRPNGRPTNMDGRGIRDLPRTADEAQASAARAGFVIPDPCLPGVVASLALLERHAATLRERA